jgi:hypothetical protein
MTTAKKTKLQELCEFLLSNLKPIVKANNMDAWQERGTLIINGEDKGQGGYQVAKWKYTAVIAIENFPHKKIDAYNVLAMVAAYLIDNDSERDNYSLDDPEIDIDVISNDNAMVIIEVMLIDNIELIPDSQGPIIFNGQRFCVATATFDLAEDVNVAVKNA